MHVITSQLHGAFYLQVLGYNTALTGNGAEALIYADGEESSSERRGADASVAGNQLSGTFTLTLRGWETEVWQPWMQVPDNPTRWFDGADGVTYYPMVYPEFRFQ